jgi:hypothetical protein
MKSDSAARGPVLAGALSCAAMIAQHVGGRSTRDAIFLSSFDVARLPATMIAASAVSMLSAVAVARLLAKHTPARAVPWLFASGAIAYVAELGVSFRSMPLAAALVYLHFALFGTTLISAFWSLVTERFDPHAAKRAVARIASGGALGGVLGGLVSWKIAGLVGPRGMLAALAAASTLAALGTARVAASGPAEAPAERRIESARASFRALSGTPYLLHLGAFVLFGAALQTLLDFQLSARAALALPDRRELLGFFALFNTAVAALSFVTQLSLTRVVLERLGLAATVAALPVLTGALALFGAAVPSFGAVVAARGAEAMLRSSMHRAGYELFFTPLSPEKRRGVKTLIDVGFDRVGAILGSAGTLAIVAIVARASVERWVLGAVAATALAAALVCFRLHRGYVRALEESLEAGAVDLSDLEILDLTTRRTLARAGAFGKELLATKLDKHRARASEEAALEDLLRGLEDPSLEVREACAASLLRLPLPDARTRERVVAHAVRELEALEAAKSEERARRVAHVLLLLAVAYDREPMRMAHRALRAADGPLRGTAIEYLDVVLPSEVRDKLFPHLDLAKKPAQSGKAPAELARELMRADETE